MFVGSAGQLVGLAMAAVPLLRPDVSPSEGWVVVAGPSRHPESHAFYPPPPLFLF